MATPRRRLPAVRLKQLRQAVERLRPAEAHDPARRAPGGEAMAAMVSSRGYMGLMR